MARSAERIPGMRQCGHLRFVVQVRDRVHLAQLMRNLRRLPEVTRLQRN